MPDDLQNASGSQPETPLEKIDFFFRLEPGHRTTFIHGAHGGVTPRGHIQMSLYAERLPFPLVSEAKLRPSGTIEYEEVVEREEIGLIRDVPLTAMLTESSARAIAKWLVEQADILAEIKSGQAPKDNADDDDVQPEP